MRDGNLKREQQTSSSDGDFGLKVAQITLPKGGGAIHGIGEKFTANPVTGTDSMSVPLAVSPGRAGFGPQLSNAEESDVFVPSGSEDLVPVLDQPDGEWAREAVERAVAGEVYVVHRSGRASKDYSRVSNGGHASGMATHIGARSRRTTSRRSMAGPPRAV